MDSDLFGLRFERSTALGRPQKPPIKGEKRNEYTEFHEALSDLNHETLIDPSEEESTSSDNDGDDRID